MTPKNRGAAPSKPDTASARSEPMIQVTPDDSRASMNMIAAKSPSTLPAPVSVTPEDVTEPP